jgi:hypothetical protein
VQHITVLLGRVFGRTIFVKKEKRCINTNQMNKEVAALFVCFVLCFGGCVFKPPPPVIQFEILRRSPNDPISEACLYSIGTVTSELIDAIQTGNAALADPLLIQGPDTFAYVSSIENQWKTIYLPKKSDALDFIKSSRNTRDRFNLYRVYVETHNRSVKNQSLSSGVMYFRAVSAPSNAVATIEGKKHFRMLHGLIGCDSHDNAGFRGVTYAFEAENISVWDANGCPSREYTKGKVFICASYQ